MRTSLWAIIVALMLATGAVAQDVSPMKRVIDKLPKPVTAEQLSGLATDHPNAYVYFVQDFLAGRGTFKGTADGQLKAATIKALMAYCREHGIEAVCGSGPLTPGSVAAVAGAVVADLVPVLPAGWKIDTGGPEGAPGIKADIEAAGATSLTLHLSGTAVRDGYVNINLSDIVAAIPGNWAGEVTGLQSIAPGSAARHAAFSAALFSDTAYLADLFPQVQVPADGVARKLSGSAAPTPETTRLMPYVQLYVFKGDVIDTVLELSTPSFGKQ
jgi:hypothetical protein